MTALTPNSTTARVLAAGVLAAAALGLAAGTSSAAGPGSTSPQTFTASQLAAGRSVAASSSTLHVLGDFFAHAPKSAATRSSDKGTGTRVVGGSVTVSTLNADFVAGKGGAPVSQPSYIATDVVSAGGQTATVQTARTAKGWEVVNIATGTDETDYAAKARGNGTVFNEPQIHGWYVLRGDRVLPLNTEARAVVGASGTSVAGYYQHVHGAYGDKLPGSGYDKQGKAGGFGNEAGDAVVAANRATVTAASHSTGGNVTEETALLAAAGAALALGGVLGGRRLLRR